MLQDEVAIDEVFRSPDWMRQRPKEAKAIQAGPGRPRSRLGGYLWELQTEYLDQQAQGTRWEW